MVEILVSTLAEHHHYIVKLINNALQLLMNDSSIASMMEKVSAIDPLWVVRSCLTAKGSQVCSSHPLNFYCSLSHCQS